MLTDYFPTHFHSVPPEHGILLYKGLQMLQDHANKLYNEGLANDDRAMVDGATVLMIKIQDCITRQFDSYSVDHLSQSVFNYPQKAKQ